MKLGWTVREALEGMAREERVRWCGRHDGGRAYPHWPIVFQPSLLYRRIHLLSAVTFMGEGKKTHLTLEQPVVAMQFDRQARRCLSEFLHDCARKAVVVVHGCRHDGRTWGVAVWL